MKTKIALIFFSILMFSFSDVFAQTSWVQTSNLFSGNDYVPALVASPNGTVLASTWSTGLYRTTDNGDNWTQAGLTGSFIYDLAIAPDGNFFAFVTTNNNHSIYRSTDDGLTWSQVFTRSHPNNFMNGGGVVFSDSIFVATLSFTLGPTLGDIGVDIVRSTDYGATWQFVQLMTFWGFTTDLTQLSDGRILATTALQGVWYSTDFGGFWQQLTTSPSVFTYKITTNSNGDIFLGRNSAANSAELLFKSTDNGTNWISTGIIGNIDGGEIESIFIDNNDQIYVAAHLYGPSHSTIYHSTDNGQSWEEFYDGIPSSQITYSLAGAGNGIIFAGTESSGVYKRMVSVPVELSSFSASVYENEIILNWRTATETNNSGFAIERSEDDQNFSQVGFIPGAGTTTEPMNYSFSDNYISTGKYYYRLKQIDYDGSSEYSNVVEAEIDLPSEFSLEQNYPNPFNPSTTISFTIPAKEFVNLKIYDVMGNEIATLINEEMPAGFHSSDFNAAGLSSGTYFYKLQAGSKILTQKMILMK